MKQTKIPSTDSISELAAFWDTHDVTDLEDELEDVEEAVFKRVTEETVTIELPAQEVEALKQMAQAERIGHAALSRKWVHAKLHRV